MRAAPQPHRSDNTRGRVWRTPRHTAVGVMAALALAGSLTTAPVSSSDRATEVATPEGSISLSMSVTPGEPVPLSLVRLAAASEFDMAGARGAGIDVALIDSGVTPVRGLDQPGKVIYGPDLSNEGGIQNLANLDTYGHGTHLAGIINGNDGAEVLGIAPDSRIVSLKVAGATGETHIAQVIAAIDWVVEHRNRDGLNIRVLNLSLGMPGVQTNVGDPLSAAVERAWAAGIVVVTAVGNRGNNVGGVDSPAVSPYVIGVGAHERYNAYGSADSIPSWTSGGNAFRTADLVAPGKSIMSFRVPGSFLDQAHPSAIVRDRYFKGSGTSQAAAVVTGYVAALLSRFPHLTPDETKYLLTSRANDMSKFSLVDGYGKLDAGESARRERSSLRAPVQAAPLAVTGLAVDPATFGSDRWSGGTWNGASWSGGQWSGASWSGASWSGASWSGASWSGASWSGASWSGASWSGASWSGASWSGASWSGASWAGASWSGETWG